LPAVASSAYNVSEGLDMRTGHFAAE